MQERKQKLCWRFTSAGQLALTGSLSALNVRGAMGPRAFGADLPVTREGRTDRGEWSLGQNSASAMLVSATGPCGSDLSSRL